MKKIENLINQVKVINDKYDVIKRINGDDFNIFSILKVENKEVETHSRFIYELLNPKGSHNQGDIFLQLFLKQILKKKEYKNMGSIIEVKDETPTDKKRKIDFTIETSNMFIAIEMKINASDGDKQLWDYYQYIKNKKGINKLYYLTRDGKEAKKNSINELKADKDYFRISFYYDIYSWIEQCIEKTATKPTIREGLVHYRNLIKKLTNQMGDEMDESIIELIKTPSDMKAMYTIYNKYQTILAKKESEFWFALKEKIEEKLESTTFEISYLVNNDSEDIKNGRIDYTIIEEERSHRNHNFFGLNFKYSIDTYTIKCDIYQYDSDEYMTMDYRYFKNEKKIKLDSNQKDILEEVRFTKEFNEYAQYFEFKKKINFFSNKKKPTYELFDNTKFQNIVEKIANESSTILNKILEKKEELLEMK